MRVAGILIIVVVSSAYAIFGCAGECGGKNEEIARAFIEAWSAHDIEGITALFSETCLYEEVASGRSYTTREGIADYARSTISGVPDSKFTIMSSSTNDSIAAIEWIWSGTNSVGWPSMGIPATGNKFELRGASIMTIEDGLIKRNSDYWDWGTFLNVIGVK